MSSLARNKGIKVVRQKYLCRENKRVCGGQRKGFWIVVLVISDRLDFLASAPFALIEALAFADLDLRYTHPSSTLTFLFFLKLHCQ